MLTHRPALLIEVGELSIDEVTTVLHATGYRLYDAEANMRPASRALRLGDGGTALLTNSMASVA